MAMTSRRYSTRVSERGVTLFYFSDVWHTVWPTCANNQLTLIDYSRNNGENELGF